MHSAQCPKRGSSGPYLVAAILAATDRPLAAVLGSAWETVPPEWAIVPIILLLIWAFMRSNFLAHHEQAVTITQLEAVLANT